MRIRPPIERALAPSMAAEAMPETTEDSTDRDRTMKHFWTTILVALLGLFLTQAILGDPDTLPRQAGGEESSPASAPALDAAAPQPGSRREVHAGHAEIDRPRAQALSQAAQTLLDRVARIAGKPERELARVCTPDDVVALREIYSGFQPALDGAHLAVVANEDRVLSARIKNGQFEQLPLQQRVPAVKGGKPLTRVIWNKNQRANVRQLVRVYPGEDVELDSASRHFHALRQSRREVLRQYLETL